MYTRIILGNDIWFVVDESIEEITEKFNNDSSTLSAKVIDGYEIAIVKDRIICFVSVSITEELNVEVAEEEVAK
jgi:hypothetical protein